MPMLWAIYRERRIAIKGLKHSLGHHSGFKRISVVLRPDNFFGGQTTSIAGGVLITNFIYAKLMTTKLPLETLAL